jgi:hypothetical protein
MTYFGREISLLVAIAGVFSAAVGCKGRQETVAAESEVKAGPVVQQDPPSTHGMLLFGSGPYYLSHLPMFHRPHDYQVILEVEMSVGGQDIGPAYVADRKASQEPYYTIVPETFVLPTLFPGPSGAAQRQSFKASLVRGHFERGGQTIKAGVNILIKRVVFARKFNPAAAALPSLQYIVFGGPKELFGAHLIQKKPDFDHVMRLRLTTPLTDPAQAAAVFKGGLLDLTSTSNSSASAPGDSGNDASVEGTVKATGVNFTSGAEVLESIYMEVNELSN